MSTNRPKAYPRKLLATFRHPDPTHYPELQGYSRNDIYEGTMGGGALYLAAKMARTMHLQAGQIVLDLGCGRGVTSAFLAKVYGVTVIAADLWHEASIIDETIQTRGLRGRVIPLHLDAVGVLPFAADYFDAIFCQNSLSFFGGRLHVLRKLATHLKPGGVFCAGGEILDDEMTPDERRHPPAVYSFMLPDGIDVWADDFAKMHTPLWWANQLRATGELRVYQYGEVDDAAILYEDMVLWQIEQGWNPEEVWRTIDQIVYSRACLPRMTLFTITAARR